MKILLLEQNRIRNVYNVMIAMSCSIVRRNELFTTVPVDSVYLNEIYINTYIFLLNLHYENLAFYHTHMVLIATGTEQQAAKTVCSISTRVICRSSRFVVCLVVRMLRIVSKANKPKTPTGNTAKITATSKYA